MKTIIISFILVVASGYSNTRSMTYIGEFTSEENCQKAADKLKVYYQEPKCIEVKGFKR